MPLRVLHVIPTLDLSSGGPMAILNGLATSQIANELNISILSTFVKGGDSSPAAELQRLGVRIVMIGPVRGKLMQHPSMAQAVKLAVLEADVVHIHAVWEELQHQTARACQQLGVPYIVTPHGMLTTWSTARRKWAKRLFLAWRVRANLNNATLMHFLTRAECNHTAPMGLKPLALIHAGDGLRLEEFETLPARGSFRRRFSQIGERPLMLFMGRIVLEKGLRHLIRALTYVRPWEAVLAIVGPDVCHYEATLRSEIVRLGLQDRVVFTGMLTGKSRIEALVDADIFCAPSDQESFGVAIVEALAAGLPALVSEGVSIHQEIIEAGVGELFTNDAKSMAAVISRWLQVDSMRREAASKCRTFVWNHFGDQGDRQFWARVYREMIASGPKSAI